MPADGRYTAMQEVKREEVFNREGWTFTAGNDYINEYMERHGNQNISGLCVYANKVLYVRDPESTIHEFGHFYQRNTLYPFEIIRLYELEAESLSSVIGDYCLTNSSEYFAEAFDLYIKCLENPNEIARFKNNAPLTWEYFENLRNNNWEIV